MKKTSTALHRGHAHEDGAVEHGGAVVHGDAVERRHPRARAALQRRIVDEFTEMCGHPVTAIQAARLFGLQTDVCRRILDELARRGDLRRVRGQYALHSARP